MKIAILDFETFEPTLMIQSFGLIQLVKYFQSDMYQPLLLSIDQSKCLCRGGQGKPPLFKNNVLETQSIENNIYFNEVIPEKGKFEWGFFIDKDINWNMMFAGLAFSDSPFQEEDGVSFMLGTGGAKYGDSPDGKTRWDMLNSKKPEIQPPLMITFKVDRQAHFIDLLFNGKFQKRLPLTQKMKNKVLRPRLMIVQSGNKSNKVTVNPKHCQICYSTIDLSHCGKCKNVSYCGVECQKKDWQKHKNMCLK